MISFVPLTLDDSAALKSIHKACLQNSWSQATFNELLKENLTCGWKAVSEDALPVGFILARVLNDEAEILTFAVIPSFQGKGVGRSLLNELFSLLKSTQCVKIFLEVAKDNEGAIRLYESLGFMQIGVRPNYYQREDRSFISANVMVCNLK